MKYQKDLKLSNTFRGCPKSLASSSLQVTDSNGSLIQPFFAHKQVFMGGDRAVFYRMTFLGHLYF
jgi:hypothetical protein